jgi:hypothetical protein
MYVLCSISVESSNDTFWIKPVSCYIERPFCAVRWAPKRKATICPYYSGQIITQGGNYYIKCNFKEIESKDQV